MVVPRSVDTMRLTATRKSSEGTHLKGSLRWLVVLVEAVSCMPSDHATIATLRAISANGRMTSYADDAKCGFERHE